MKLIEIKNGGVYLAKDSYGRDVEYRAKKYEPKDKWDHKHNIEFVIESLNPEKNCDGLLVDKFGNYEHEIENALLFGTYKIVEEPKMKKFEVGDIWLNYNNCEFKIVHVGKTQVVTEYLTDNILFIFNLNGESQGSYLSPLIKKKPNVKKLKVKGYIPLYKTSKGDVGTWFTQIISDKKIAEELLVYGKRELGTSSFGSASGRYDAWKVIEHEFEIEVELD